MQTTATECRDDFGELRNYTDSKFQDRVERTYREMQTNQTVEFVAQNKAKYAKLAHGKMDAYQVFKLLEQVHDESDPDNDLPQIVHAYQSAESIVEFAMLNETELRDDLSIKALFKENVWQALPQKWRELYEKNTLKSLYNHITDWSWFPLVGFIHDLGKVMLLPQFGSLQQWAVVGDTYPVAAPFSASNVFYANGYYTNCPDYKTYNTSGETKFGKYPRNCGFDNVDMTWGHDEYIYEVMQQGSVICPEGLYILRYHSFYPWHTPQNGVMAYTELASDFDWLMLPLLKAFQKADLYSKTPNLPAQDVLEAKYHKLLDLCIPNKQINW
ncbi:MAG: inositol oxygenase [Burkholderiales bacterium]|nr:inositol oxygenase [Burkholderiales bacterium]